MRPGDGGVPHGVFLDGGNVVGGSAKEPDGVDNIDNVIIPVPASQDSRKRVPAGIATGMSKVKSPQPWPVSWESSGIPSMPNAIRRRSKDCSLSLHVGAINPSGDLVCLKTCDDTRNLLIRDMAAVRYPAVIDRHQNFGTLKPVTLLEPLAQRRHPQQRRQRAYNNASRRHLAGQAFPIDRVIRLADVLIEPVHIDRRPLIRLPPHLVSLELYLSHPAIVALERDGVHKVGNPAGHCNTAGSKDIQWYHTRSKSTLLSYRSQQFQLRSVPHLHTRRA